MGALPLGDVLSGPYLLHIILKVSCSIQLKALRNEVWEINLLGGNRDLDERKGHYDSW